MACARWLQQCLAIGWKKSDLDLLQDIWWQWHDDDGQLLRNPRQAA